MRKRRSTRWWFYILVPVVSGILTVSFIELALVLLFPVPFSIESNMYFSPNEFTGYMLEPDSIGYFQNKIIAQTNAYGHRDEMVSLTKPKDVFRILVLGDSFTVGSNVTQEETYAEVLEKLLNQYSSSHVEVINSGVGGWDPFQYAQYYEHYAWKFSPDMILIGFFVGNDAYSQIKDVAHTPTAILGRRVSREATAKPFIHLKVFLYNNFNIARLVYNTGPIKRNFKRRSCSDFTSQYLSIQRNRLSNHFRRTRRREQLAQNGVYQIQRIMKIAERESIALGVILIPDENQINLDLQASIITEVERGQYDFDMPQSMLRDMFTGLNIPVIDLLPYFRADSRCLYMNDTHWTPTGHALASEVIFKNIVSGNRWPGLSIAPGNEAKKNTPG
jgi:hypothetical protein